MNSHGGLACMTMASGSDRELYLDACAGDRAAFQQLAERHHSYSVRLAATLAHDTATAEDIAHKAWLNVCRHIKQVEDTDRDPLELAYDSSFLAWLKRVTTNVAHDEFRRQARHSVREIEEEDVVFSPDFSEQLVLGERQSTVWRAFRSISAKCQELLLLLIQDPPLDYRAVSEILERPIGSIGPTRARCLEQLRAELQVQ